MVYQFSICSTESNPFQLNVSLNGNSTFFDFHTFIQDMLGYESYQVASFFLSDSRGRRQVEISLLGSGFKGPVFYNMHNTRIDSLILSPEQKLLYTFDFINDRSFYIELIGIIMEQNLLEPMVNLKQGNPPLQILGDAPAATNDVVLQEEEIFMDFGELEDYTELYGDMNDF